MRNHRDAYGLGVVIFTAISLGKGSDAFIMLWLLIWWTVGVAAHFATAGIIFVATRHTQR
ncbi:hypothetical protein [Hyphobacterium sp.]|uniref:hypothetical protein n=1 Tax=Hyphobacterium sp. TaxID=2004662 RepID=UPI003B527F0A